MLGIKLHFHHLYLDSQNVHRINIELKCKHLCFHIDMVELDHGKLFEFQLKIFNLLI